MEPEFSSAGIVILGSFNPPIFHPQFLFRHNIEQEEDEQGREDKKPEPICTPDHSMFTIESTNYYIDRERFQIQTDAAPYITILDKVSRLFGEILIHTPCSILGLNRDVHFHVKSNDHRNLIGRRLAPIEPWGDFGRSLENSDDELRGGLQSLTMRAIEKTEDYELQKNVKIEPSNFIKGQDGIYMQVNYHYIPSDPSKEAKKNLEILCREFQSRLNEAEKIFDLIRSMK